MNMPLLITTLAAVVAMSPTQAQAPSVRTTCFAVKVQNDAVNRASVEQSCAHNISRTVQAGGDNRAQTVQAGVVNDNKVRQFSYQQLRFGERRRRP